MNKFNKEKHEFAFYAPDTVNYLIEHPKPRLFTLDNADLYHRIIHVLRLSKEDQFILFDQTNHIQCSLETVEKKKLSVKILAQNQNLSLSPSITFLLPLLKREAFHETIYALCELGATHIQPIITQHSQRKWTEKEKEKTERIIHAAAEQSKNFAFPDIAQPVKLEDFLENKENNHISIFFDPDGKPLLQTINALAEKFPQEIRLMIGPEADLTPDEKKALEQNNFSFCALTPTILRAQQAAVVSLGIIRSLIRS